MFTAVVLVAVACLLGVGDAQASASVARAHDKQLDLLALETDSNDVWWANGVALAVVALSNEATYHLQSHIFGNDTFNTVEVIVATTGTAVAIPPTIDAMCKLGVVYLGGVSGGIPTQMGNLERLRMLTFGGLTESFPSQLGRLRDLVVLSLQGGPCCFALPSQIFQLSNLKALLLQIPIPTTIPRQLQALTSLGQLVLGGELFEGTLPSQIGSLPVLDSLVVDSNDLLSSSLPSELAQLSSTLRELSAGECQLSGQLPSQLGLLAKLEVLVLSDNLLAGTLPSEVGALRRVQTLQVDINLLSGPLPSQLGALTECTTLRLGGNEFSGTIPRSLFRLGRLQEVMLGPNELEGGLPTQVGLLTGAVSLEVGPNPSLSGTLPTQLGLLALLTALDLEGCGFHGPLPTELGLLSTLSLLRVSYNRLSSSLPTALAALVSLGTLDVEHNALAGTIPAQLVASLSLLTHVRIAHNAFEGTIDADGAAASGWLDRCDQSGLSRSQCALRCVPCSSHSFKARDCGDSDQSPVCVPILVLPLLLVAGVAWVLVAVESVAGEPLGKWGRVVLAALSAYALLDLMTDVLFAVGSGGIIRALSFLGLGLVLGGALLLSLWVQHREEVHGDNKGVARWVGVTVAVMVYPGALRFVTRSTERLNKPIELVLIPLSVLETLFQGTLQVVSALSGSPTTITLIALALSAITVLSRVSVFIVVSLTRGSQREERRFSGVELGIIAALRQASVLARPTVVAAATGTEGARPMVVLFSRDDQNVPGAGEANDKGRASSASSPNTTKRKRRVRAVLCCGVAVAAVLSASRPPSHDQPPVIRLRFENHERATSNVATPLHQRAVVPVVDPAVLQKAECPASWLSTDGLTVFFGGFRIGIFSMSPTSADLVGPVVQAAPTMQFFTSRAQRSPLPSEIGLATGCKVLLVSECRGPVPSQIGLMRDSRVITLVDWDAGTLPSQIGKLSQLTHLALTASVRGPLPSQLGLLPLSVLHVANTVVGELPTQLAAITTLTYLYTNNTRARGANILDSIAPGVEYMVIARNELTGTLPTSLGTFTKLVSLPLDHNGFSGSIPSEIGQLSTKLKNLFLDDNRLSGSIPSQLARLDQLVVMRVGNNALDGSVPSELGRLRLEALLAGSNELRGSLPSQLGRLTALVDFGLDHNSLGGRLPSEMGGWTALERLLLNDNFFSGTVPSQLSLLSALRELDLSNNRLHGPLPSQLAALTLLEALRVDHNRFGGTLPAQFAALLRLTSVSIAANGFSGDWPVGGSALAVWTESCDYSGMEAGQACARHCPPCSQLGVTLTGCDPRGFGKVCAPWYALFPSLVAVLVAVWFLVSTTSGRQLSRKRRTLLATGSMFAALQWLVAVQFATTAATHALRALSGAVLGLRLFITFVVATAELAHVASASESSVAKLVQSLLHCALDPFTVLELSRTGPRSKTKLAVLGTVLTTDAAMMVLESVALHALEGHAGDTVTTLALALSCASLVSCGRVLFGGARASE